ncbi:molecular chaperone DnaJ [Gordonia bronchialis]|nr:molecular chaperone DnaJ [Gordonia bronchialis]
MILSVNSMKGHLSFPCDKFVTWQENLRAIALALEALRKVERYGITPNNEQYRGWQQLPAAGSSSPMSADQAERVLRMAARLDEVVPGRKGDLTLIYRAARVNAHPDRNCGDQKGWDAVGAAAEVLRAAGRLP